jgi:hypothetical protein
VKFVEGLVEPMDVEVFLVMKDLVIVDLIKMGKKRLSLQGRFALSVTLKIGKD